MVSFVANKIEYDNIVLFLEGKDNLVNLDKDKKKRLKKKASKFILIEGGLYLYDKENLHKRVFHMEQLDLIKFETKRFHDEHHYGINRFEVKCNDYFFKIPRDVIREVIANCTVCAQSQPLKTKEKLVHITALRPMERLQIDLIDMRRYKDSNDQFSWILTIIDVYSKYAWAFPLLSKTSSEISKTLESLFYMLGPPQILQSDNGKEFINADMKGLCDRFSISYKHSSPRHPQSQGQVERFNQTLTRYLQKHVFQEEMAENVSGKQWKKHLLKVVYDYNLAKHSATNKTPFRLFLQIPGFNTIVQKDNENALDSLPTPDICPNNTNSNSTRMEDDFIREPSVSQEYLDRMNKHASVHNSIYDFNVGDKVLVAKSFDKNEKTKKLKLSSFYSEEVVITEILSNNRVKIKNKDKEEIVFMSKIKKVQ
ncbi:Gag-Pol polyprotein [Nosema granulosis]|uniref:Gag-Pol polyprotein n=1 Tax=Nosema granulosis TaxID=83296 RepID=A0A9P6GUV0_9MICR|nr:Gag-Pol polyprotein [Nosema granulosis]